ncbi:MAG TPA: hypothetical protein VFS14_00715 [Candidatus Saccharimonadales bacterium]|nr:hypothetical protein [Candidatus Saccharimonadales bacterium]
MAPNATIIPRNQSLSATPFNMFHLPPMVPGTNGMALPKADTVSVLCIAPGGATTHNDNWGQELTLHPGDPHLALAPDDTYPNQVFHRDYVPVEPAPDHRLAAVLRDFWQQRGYAEEDLRDAWRRYLERFSTPPRWAELVRAQVEAGEVFFLARKEQPVLVRGVVDLRFMTSEGPTRLEHGSVLVEHPDDATNQWLLRADKFAGRYNWVEEPASGLLIPEVD